MGRNRYRLLGWAVWRGARWYLRRRLVAVRRVAAAVAVLAGALALAVRFLRTREAGPIA